MSKLNKWWDSIICITSHSVQLELLFYLKSSASNVSQKLATKIKGTEENFLAFKEIVWDILLCSPISLNFIKLRL